MPPTCVPPVDLIPPPGRVPRAIASGPRRRSLAIGLLVAGPLVTGLLAVVALAGLPAADAARPGDPRSNTSASAIRACDAARTSYTRACLRGALRDIDRGRAKERVRPIRLPSNFVHLTSAEQLFVVTEMERIDRGLPPIAGLSHTLDEYAAQGARTADDPPFPRWTREGGGNWASPENALVSDFYWVYADGPGSFNVECHHAGQSGCWGHRHNVLSRWSAPRMMGAATASNGSAELFLGQDHHDRCYFTWAREKRYLAHPITAASLGS